MQECLEINPLVFLIKITRVIKISRRKLQWLVNRHVEAVIEPRIAKMLAKIFTTVKYTLVSVNFLFLITGIIILSVGSSVQSAYNGYHEFLSERFFSLPAFCIATGVIIFLISFAGFYGAFMENYYIIMAFVGSMVLMFIFQLAACIGGYVLRGNTVALVQQQLQSSMQLYDPQKNFAVTVLWDEVQRDFNCCGVIDSRDWLTPLGTNDSQGVPVSCCAHVWGAVNTFTCNTTIAFDIGCAAAFGSWVQQHVAAIGISGVVLVLLQALAVGGAVWLANITRQEREFP